MSSSSRRDDPGSATQRSSTTLPRWTPLEVTANDRGPDTSGSAEAAWLARLWPVLRPNPRTDTTTSCAGATTSHDQPCSHGILPSTRSPAPPPAPAPAPAPAPLLAPLASTGHALVPTPVSDEAVRERDLSDGASAGTSWDVTTHADDRARMAASPPAQVTGMGCSAPSDPRGDVTGRCKCTTWAASVPR